MKITVYYEDKSHPITLEVPDEECTVMVETDYRQRLAVAEDKDAIMRRTMQEIMDEDFNKAAFNNHHAETRRHVSLTALDPKEKAIVGAMDVETDLLCEDYSNLYAAIQMLKPKQREILRKLFLEGMKQVEIAREMGLAKSTISERIDRIYLSLKKNLTNRKNFS